MGRREQGPPWSLRLHGSFWYVRFRHEGRRHEYTTGHADRPHAERAAVIIYAKSSAASG